MKLKKPRMRGFLLSKLAYLLQFLRLHKIIKSRFSETEPEI